VDEKRGCVKVIDQHITERFAAYHGDCVEVMRGFPCNSVDYSVFSPPFASLYTYSNSERDMGNSRDYSEFWRHYEFLVQEQLRTLKPGRLLSFHCMNLPTVKQFHGYIGIIDFRGDLIRAYQRAGFIFHSEVCIWKDPVTAMQRTKALGLLYKQLRKDSCMSRQGVPDYLVTMRKPGQNDEPVTKTHDGFPVGKWQQYASPVWMDINPSDTLQRESAREEADERHICPLQLQVIERAIELWTNPNDLVCSPYMGIGSEGYVSLKMGRRFAGIELKGSYYKQAVGNLIAAERDLPQMSLLEQPA
jgi:DNA modification methylase